MKRTTVTTVLAAALAAAAFGLIAAGPAAAVDDIVIEIDEVTFGDPGEVIELARVDVPAELVGRTCFVEFTRANNESTHPDNNLIVASGDEVGVVEDVETTPGDTQTVDADAVLGEEIVVSIELGPDGVSSSGFVLTFDCQRYYPPTTTTEAPPTTEPPVSVAPTTIVPETSTTLPPTQVGGAVEAQPTFTG